MSGSKPDTAIYLSDSPETVRTKINTAYTGSLTTLIEHKKYGAIPEICSIFQLLRYHHPDTSFVNDIYKKYKKGIVSATELKGLTITFVNEYLKKHQEKVRKVINTDQFLLRKSISSFLDYETYK